MFWKHSSRAVRQQWRGSSRSLGQRLATSANRHNSPRTAAPPPCQLFHPPRALFHATRNLEIVKPVLLADIGEGIAAQHIPCSDNSTNLALLQALSSAKSSNGSSNPAPGWKNSPRYARSKATRRPSKSQAASRAWSRSYTMTQGRWPRWASPLSISTSRAMPRRKIWRP